MWTFTVQKELHSTVRGFTLVETLVAITILLVAIVGPMTIAQRGLQSAFFTQERITATYLAQEGVEVMRAIRDEHMLSGNDWMDAMDDTACTENDGCDYDIKALDGGDIGDVESTLIDCGESDDECLLYYNDEEDLEDAVYLYHHDQNDGSPSLYTRRISIDEDVSTVESEVTVTVSWDSGIFQNERSVTLTDRLFNYHIETDGSESDGGGGGTWTQCAVECYPPDRSACTTESQYICSFSGTADVRYGAEEAAGGGPGAWATLENQNAPVYCNNDTFGDPLYGTPKVCEYLQ